MGAAILLFAYLVVIALMFGIPYIKRENAKRSVTVGKQYVLHDQQSNPWLDEYDVRTVLEIRNGWVKYGYGPDLCHESTLPLESFALIYVEYRPFTKKSA